MSSSLILPTNLKKKELMYMYEEILEAFLAGEIPVELFESVVCSSKNLERD